MKTTRMQRFVISLYCSLMAISSLPTGKCKLAEMHFAYSNAVNSVVKAELLPADQVPANPNFQGIQRVALTTENQLGQSLHDVGMIIFDNNQGLLLPQDDLVRKVGLISEEQTFTTYSFSYKGETVRTFDVLQDSNGGSQEFMMVSFNKTIGIGDMYLTTINGHLIKGVHGESGQAIPFDTLTSSQAKDFRKTVNFWTARKNNVLLHLQKHEDVASIDEPIINPE